MATPPAEVLVVGRYGGTVAVLSGILRSVDGEVTAAAVDVDGLPAVRWLVTGRRWDAVVVTAAPGDPTVAAVISAVPARRICAVAWHPDDERPPLPIAATVVPAGQIHRTLSAVVGAVLSSS